MVGQARVCQSSEWVVGSVHVSVGQQGLTPSRLQTHSELQGLAELALPSAASWSLHADYMQMGRRTHCWPRQLEGLESQGC